MNAAREEARKTSPILGGALFLIIALLFVSIGVQLGVINPVTQGNRDELHDFACAQAELVANASRLRQVGKDGRVEPRRDYLTRLLAQRRLLLLAPSDGCESAPGFPTFEAQVDRALKEINGILGYRRHSRRALEAMRGEATGEPRALAMATPEIGGSPRSTGGSENTPTGGDIHNGAGGDRDGQGRDEGDGQTGGQPEGQPDGPQTDPGADSPAPPGDIQTDAPTPPPTPSNPPAAPPPSVPETRPSLLPENLIPDTVEATGKAAGEAVEGVGGVVGETGKAVDCVLRGGC